MVALYIDIVGIDAKKNRQVGVLQNNSYDCRCVDAPVLIPSNSATVFRQSFNAIRF